MPKFKLKNDKFRKARGGNSRLLEIKCSACNSFLCFYQKDGPGILKRTYLDRIFGQIETKENNFVCPKCKKAIGYLGIYEKENRPVYNLFPLSIKKKIVKNN